MSVCEEFKKKYPINCPDEQLSYQLALAIEFLQDSVESYPVDLYNRLREKAGNSSIRLVDFYAFCYDKLTPAVKEIVLMRYNIDKKEKKVAGFSVDNTPTDLKEVPQNEKSQLVKQYLIKDAYQNACFLGVEIISPLRYYGTFESDELFKRASAGVNAVKDKISAIRSLDKPLSLQLKTELSYLKTLYKLCTSAVDYKTVKFLQEVSYKDILQLGKSRYRIITYETIQRLLGYDDNSFKHNYHNAITPLLLEKYLKVSDGFYVDIDKNAITIYDSKEMLIDYFPVEENADILVHGDFTKIANLILILKREVQLIDTTIKGSLTITPTVNRFSIRGNNYIFTNEDYYRNKIYPALYVLSEELTISAVQGDKETPSLSLNATRSEYLINHICLPRFGKYFYFRPSKNVPIKPVNSKLKFNDEIIDKKIDNFTIESAYSK